MPQIRLSSGIIDYEDTGGPGPLLVLVHGVMMSGTVWSEVVSRLAPAFRCVVPTMPLGAHVRPMEAKADQSMEGLARLLSEFLERLDLTDVTLVQNDWGVVQPLLAVADTTRLSRLVITSCEAFDNYPPPPARLLPWVSRVPGGLLLAARAMLLRPVRQALGWRLMSKRPVPDDMFREWLRPLVADRSVRRDLAKYFLSPPTSDDLLRWAAAVTTFPGPVLVAWAPEDRVMPIRHAHRLVELFPQAELAEIDDSYTLIPLDQPALLAAALECFVANSAETSPGRAG